MANESKKTHIAKYLPAFCTACLTFLVKCSFWLSCNVNRCSEWGPAGEGQSESFLQSTLQNLQYGLNRLESSPRHSTLEINLQRNEFVPFSLWQLIDPRQSGDKLQSPHRCNERLYNWINLDLKRYFLLVGYSTKSFPWQGLFTSLITKNGCQPELLVMLNSICTTRFERIQKGRPLEVLETCTCNIFCTSKSLPQ